MSDQKDLLNEMLAITMSNQAYRLAIIEDYIELASKIENIDPEKIKERIDKKQLEYFKKVKADLLSS